MKTFETFIESEAFFPVLILLLVMLVSVFMWIVLSNKKEEQKRREKKRIKIDENAEIKIVFDGLEHDDVKMQKTKREQTDDEPERTEIAIVEEVATPNDYINIENDKKEIIYDIDLPNFNEARFTSEDKEDLTKNVFYGDLSVPPVPDIFLDDDFSETKSKETGNDLVKDKSVDNNEKDENVIEVEKEESSVETNAFNSTPTSDREIHEDVKVDMPKEYVGEKTEIFDFPDFNQDDIFSTGDIESEIITAAEDYIKDIMSSKKEG